MDSCGCLQVNLKKNKKLEFRIILTVKNNEENMNIFKKIRKFIGKSLITKDKKNNLFLIINTMREIEKVLGIFSKTPLINPSLICQLNFFNSCFRKPNNIMFYKKNLKKKYEDKETITKNLRLNILDKPYTISSSRLKGISINNVIYKNIYILIEHIEYFVLEILNHLFFNIKIKQQLGNKKYRLKVYNQENKSIFLERINKIDLF
jgi:hypothetical protein